MQTQFEAQWITKQVEVDGEWDPANDEYGASRHSSFEAAQKAAEAGAEHGPCCWTRVTEQHYDPNYYGHGEGGWVDIQYWIDGAGPYQDQ